MDKRESIPDRSGWKRPVLVPVPIADPKSENYLVSLNGNWKFTDRPQPMYWNAGLDLSAWDDVPVPAELYALGYEIRRGKEYVYKKNVQLPVEWKDRRIFLKIGMAYEYSKIWFNGQMIREHSGGFTSFDCEVTDYAKIGARNEICVMVMHRSDGLNDAPAPNGTQGFAGLIDDVRLLALPVNVLTRFHYETDFDPEYRDAALKVWAAVDFRNAFHAELKLELSDASGQPIAFEGDASVQLSRERPDSTAVLTVLNPCKWSAEHPYLYRLKATFSVEGRVLQTFEKNVGFRKVERIGDNLHVNGVLTKLRGAARYAHDPLLGKVFTDQQLEEEMQHLKYGNMNFIRSSAYPEREKLYELCDKYGVYAEVCAPANFQRATWDSQRDINVKNTSDMPKYKARYLEQFAEMIERDRSHPSIIIWEYANESDWGINFQDELDYAKIEDPGRLTAGTWDNTRTDIASWHYPEYDEVFPNAGLYDEFVHLTAHALKQLSRDPGIRNAWGWSLGKGWKVLFPANGVIGAAIFAMGDYTIYRPNGEIWGQEFGTWGLIDTWYREKPELWLAKKAYSPVRIEDKIIRNPGLNQTLEIEAANWYDETDFAELIFEWSIGEECGILSNCSLAPRQTGKLVLPARAWTNGEIVHLSVRDGSGMLVDRYELTLCEREPVYEFPPVSGPAPEIKDEHDAITVKGAEFELVFCKSDGMIAQGKYQGENLIKGGPYLNLYGAYYKASHFQYDRKGEFGLAFSGWKLERIQAEIQSREAVIRIVGSYPGGEHTDAWGYRFGYEDIQVSFEVRIDGNGLITTSYTVHNPPKHVLTEIGVAFILSDDIDRIQWIREGQYGAYPDNHIGRAKGTALRHRGYGCEAYRAKPVWDWAYDEADYIQFGHHDRGGHGTNDFRSSKENIWYASVLARGTDLGIRAESDGHSVSVRAGMAQDEDEGLPYGIKFTMNNALYYDLDNGSNPLKTGDGYLGNYTYPEIRLEPGYTDKVRMRFRESNQDIRVRYE